MFAERLEKLRKLLVKKNIDYLILGGVSHTDANAYYYSGEPSTPCILCISKHSAVVHSLELGDYPQFDEVKTLAEFRSFIKGLERKGGKKIALDGRSDLAGSLALRLLKKNKLFPLTKELLGLRSVKDEMETRMIKTAQRITLESIEEAVQNCWGKTENALAGKMELLAREKGASLDAFPPIVASGEYTNIIHSTPRNEEIRKGNLLLVDVGARYNFYCGDCSRTFYEGGKKEIIDAVIAVKEAVKAAKKKAVIGKKGKQASDEAVRVLREYGFKENTFRNAGLSLGHLVGLEVHDGLSGIENLTLRKGMAITIEPGIYVKGEYGVRFEDVVVL